MDTRPALIQQQEPPEPAPLGKRWEGRRPRSTEEGGNSAYYAWLHNVLGITGAQYSVRREMPTQRMSHYASGKRAIPLQLAQEIEQESRDPKSGEPLVPWTSWPWVRDYLKGKEFTYGKPGKPVRRVAKRHNSP